VKEFFIYQPMLDDLEETFRPMTEFEDIIRMHLKFGMPFPNKPKVLGEEMLEFRAKFLMEEVLEFVMASMMGDIGKATDALVDLVVVAKGTAAKMGVPWESCWDAVNIANMAKIRVDKGEGRNDFDLAKPPGWEHPDIERIVQENTYRFDPNED
tara:strand:+ start:604 stop:1065 length:462 start_codon:yes stop_codon:yes gene_type:complete